MLLSWIEAYLVGRSQFVRIEGAFPSTCSVISGVPQGSVLGPILFLIYINDISACVSQTVTTKLFADDTNCTVFCMTIVRAFSSAVFT